MMKERSPRTPASSRSIIRNHSPYCESTGPIVQEGFVAARVRALQGFSNQAQISHSPLTPCPGLHVYKSRSPPRPSLTLKPVLTGTDMPRTGTIKRFHQEILSKDHRTVVSASGRSRSSDVAPSFHPQGQQSSLGPTTPSSLYIRGRGAENPSPRLFKDTVPSLDAHRKQDHITAPSTPYSPVSEINQADTMPEENISPSEMAILSPHAIRTDLVEPRATWDCLPQTSDHTRGYSHERALKPRGSIADKLSSMVERGWVGGGTFGKVYNDDESASHTAESAAHIRNTNLDNKSDSLSETPRLKVPLYSGSLSVSTAERRSESQHSIGEDVPPHVKQKEPQIHMCRRSQKRRQRQAKRSPTVKSPQRSSSDFGVHYLKTKVATPTEKRRAWTLHHVGRSTSNHSQIQREASPTPPWPNYARDHRRSEQDHESTKSPSFHEGSTSKSGFDLITLKDGQLGQDSTALSKVTSSRRSGSHARESIRPASRSTSFFKKFPWYKVALVDKQSVVQDLSKGRRSNGGTSSSTRAAQHDPTSNQIELSRGVSKSHTPVECVECGHEEDMNAPKTKTPPNQGPLGQQAIDAKTSYYRVSSKPSLLQLMTSPQEMNERQVLEQIWRAPDPPQDSRATSLKITDGWLSKNPHEVAKDVIGHTQSSTKTGPSGTQPRVLSRSGSMDASFESPTSGDVLHSLQPRWPDAREHCPTQSSTSSYADSTKPNPDNRPEQGSSGSGTARPEYEFSASPNPSHQLPSKLVNLSAKRSGTRTDSSPASDLRSDQHRPMRRELKGRAKGIKKVQVTVTFDGAEELVIEATLKKKDRREHWRTTA